MANTQVSVFPYGAGKHINFDHTGPAAYTTGGETIGVSNSNTGISLLGLSTIDFLDVSGLSLSGNYWCMAQCSGAGSRRTWQLWWYTATNGVPNTTQVTNGTNLSGETIRLAVSGR